MRGRIRPIRRHRVNTNGSISSQTLLYKSSGSLAMQVMTPKVVVHSKRAATISTVISVDPPTVQAIHAKIPGSANDLNGWLVPFPISSNTTANVGFVIAGKTFLVPLAGLAYEDMGDGSGKCYSAVQGMSSVSWVLVDVFVMNN